MKIKKAKNLKEINICLYAFFGVLLILAIRSAFSGEKWDCAVLGLLMLILFLLFMLINLEWEVNCAGITCYILFGKQRCTRGYKRYKETSGLIERKECQIFHSIFT